MHHRQVIRTHPDLLDDPDATAAAPQAKGARATRINANRLQLQSFLPHVVPTWARASGGAGRGDLLFFAGASLALLDGFLRHEPPYAGALRKRLALMSAAASAKMLVSTPTQRLCDLHFAVGDALGPAATLASLWRDLAGRPRALDPGRLRHRGGAARPGPARNPNGLASSLKACAGEGDPVSAAGKAAAFAFSVFRDVPVAESESLALWVFDFALAPGCAGPGPCR